MIIHHLFTSALHNFSISKFWSPWRINSTSLLIETTNVDQTSTSYNRTLTLQFKTDRQTSSLFHPTLIFAIRSISKSFKQKKKKKSAGPFRGTPSRKIPRILHPRSKENSVRKNRYPLHSRPITRSRIVFRITRDGIRFSTPLYIEYQRSVSYLSTQENGKRKKGGKRRGAEGPILINFINDRFE